MGPSSRSRYPIPQRESFGGAQAGQYGGQMLQISVVITVDDMADGEGLLGLLTNIIVLLGKRRK